MADPYTPTIWVDEIPGVQVGTDLDAANFNNIENGVANAAITINPRQFGAVFDNVANDSTAIQAAIDAGSQYATGLGNGGIGAIVQLPAKRIKVNTPLRIKDGVWLRGSGPGTDLRGTADPVIGLPTSGVLPDNMMISDLTLSPTGVGIKLDTAGLTGGYRLGWPRVIVQNVTAIDAGSHAFWILAGIIIECRLINCVSLRATGFGFLNQGTDNFLIGCTGAESTLAGFNIAGGNNKLSACKAYGNDTIAYELVGAGRHMLSGCESQDNNTGYRLSGNWNNLSGCLSDTDLYGVEFTGGNHIVDCVVMYGGGGTGQVTRVGFLFSGTGGVPTTGSQVRGVTSALVPVAGSTYQNDIRVFRNDGGGHKVVAYAATITPEPYEAEVHQVLLTGNVTINAATHKHPGQRLTLNLLQDGVGGRLMTFSPLYRVNWAPDTSPNKMNTITFEHDGLFWQQISTGIATNVGGSGRADTFNRADGALGTSSSGHVWQIAMAGTGSWQVVSNRATITGAPGFNNNFALLDAGVADYSIQLEAITLPSGVGCVVWRYTDSLNYVGLFGNTIMSVVAGVQVQSVGGIVNFGVGDILRVEVAGGSVRIYKNGVLSWSGGVYTNLTATKAGMCALVNGDTYDNFSLT